MNEFLQNNLIWLNPVISIILSVVIKQTSKPEFLTLGFVDYLDFGFELSIASLLLILTGAKNESVGWLVLLGIILILIASIIVSRIGWNKDTAKLKIVGVIIPDIVGILLLVFASLYVGGSIK